MTEQNEGQVELVQETEAQQNEAEALAQVGVIQGQAVQLVGEPVATEETEEDNGNEAIEVQEEVSADSAEADVAEASA